MKCGKKVFYFNEILGRVRHLQGKIFGQMQAVGFSLKEETTLSTLTLDVLSPQR